MTPRVREFDCRYCQRHVVTESPRDKRTTFCSPECRTRWTRVQIKRWERAKIAQGLCVKCGHAPARCGQLCASCREKETLRERVRKRRKWQAAPVVTSRDRARVTQDILDSLGR